MIPPEGIFRIAVLAFISILEAACPKLGMKVYSYLRKLA